VRVFPRALKQARIGEIEVNECFVGLIHRSGGNQRQM
jgi:hypothetical protein